MKTLILHHDDCLKHDPGARHPEREDRVRSVLNSVKNIPGTEVLPAPKATPEQIRLVHEEAYVDLLSELEPRSAAVTEDPGAERVSIDPDTVISAGSIDAALRGSGAACFATDQVLKGRVNNAFCATRPPGHHAEAARAMGFCLFNHAAVAARHALAVHGVQRVAILDFDVHHGNGTQAIFESSPEVQYVSSHQMPLYPGTGHPDEVGCGNVLNLPLPPGAGSDEFRRSWSVQGLSAVLRFDPDMIIVSAGFDAHQRDPIGQLELQDADYAWITAQICALAHSTCGGRVVSILEGGYDLEALATASAAHVGELVA